MSRKQAIAQPYAKAAFELAFEDKALGQWSDMLALAAVLAEDKQVANLMKNPQFSNEQVIKLFLDMGKEKFSDKMQNFIRILGKFKRLSALPEIAKLYEQKRANAERLVKVELISAFPVDEKTQNRFVEALKNRMQCNIALTCSVNEEIIGGAIIRAGDLVIDGSVRGRLAKLSDAIGIS